MVRRAAHGCPAHLADKLSRTGREWLQMPESWRIYVPKERSRTLIWTWALGEGLRGLFVFPPHVFEAGTGPRLGALARQRNQFNPAWEA